MSIITIVAVSDSHHHNFKNNVPDGHIFIHAGDFTNRGSIEEFVSFKSKMGAINSKNKIVVAGNHDRICSRFEGLARQELKDVRTTYLFNEFLEVEGCKIYGTPFSKAFGNWSFGRQEDGLEKYFDIMPTDLDIAIAHGPAYGVLDANDEGIKCGSKTVLKHIERAQPRIFIHGHIHESRGHAMIGETHVFNVALLDERYDLKYKPTIIYYNTDTKKVEDFKQEIL